MFISAPLQGVSPAAGNSTSGIVQPLPANRTVQNLRVGFGGTVTAAQITEVQLNIGNQNLFNDVNGTFLDARNQFDLRGAFSAAQQLLIPMQPKLLDRVQAQTQLLNILGGDKDGNGGTLTFKVDGATNPTYAPAMDYLPGVMAGADVNGKYTRINKQKWTGIANGVNAITKIPFNQATVRFLSRVFMKVDTGSITRVRILNANNTPLWDFTKADNDAFLSDYEQRDPAAASNYFDFVMDLTGTGFAEMLDTLGMQALVLEITTASDATYVETWTESVGSLQ